MHIEYLSASRGDVFIGCPFRYFLQYHLKLPELGKPTIHTEKGSAAHSSLENFAKGSDHIKALQDYYAETKLWELDERPKGFVHPVAKSCDSCKWLVEAAGTKICTIANRNVADFEGCPKPNFEDDLKLVESVINKKDSALKRKIIGAEVPFDMKISNFKVKGYIDLITEIDEETIEVRDYKTGQRGKTVDDAFKDLQMRLYSAVSKILFPQYKYVLMTLDYVRTKPVTVSFSTEDDAKTIAYLDELYIKIKNSVDPPRVKSFKCDWCVGYEKCGQIRETFMKDGKFVMPPAVRPPEEKPPTNG
jgi:RecB family exonuclease